MVRLRSPRVSKKKQKPSFIKPLIIVLSLTLLGGLGYSVFTFKTQEEQYQDYFICSQDGKNCEESTHKHADLKLNVCGQDITLGKEKGNTQAQHTHKEHNKIHWHASLKVDPQTRDPLDKSRLTLASFFQEIEYTLPEKCNGKTSKTTVKVNGNDTKDELQYVWKDDDQVEITVQ